MVGNDGVTELGLPGLFRPKRGAEVVTFSVNSRFNIDFIK